jgi:hypothetical protein
MWASCAEQECQCSVLAVGTIGPAPLAPPAAWVLPAAGPGWVLRPAALGGAVVVELEEVHAVTASRAVAPTVSAAATLRLRALPPPGRGIDMDLTITHHARRNPVFRRSRLPPFAA